MDYKNYISKISFSLIEPFDQGVFLLPDHSTYSMIDIKNTILPYEDDKMKAILSEICQMPRMSTFAIAAIVNKIVSNMPSDQSFVNVGVWHGFSFLSGLAGNPDKSCVGVDNFSEFGGPRKEFNDRFNKYRSDKHLFYDMDYVDYFSKIHNDPIGFYIYDGNHSKENQLQGLKVAEPFFAKDCLILIDDINWPDPMEGTNAFIKQSRYKYKIIVEQRTSNNCHPTFWNGIAIMQRID
ncbi:MAG: class I SAM-dependent methyltransferase [Spirochaetota bacterium]|nr:class I SAM-dependent methyltransferase [Spirochaetota bacterium]